MLFKLMLQHIQQRRKTIKGSYCKILYFIFFSEVQGFRWHCSFNVDPLFLKHDHQRKSAPDFPSAWAIKFISSERKVLGKMRHFLTAETFFCYFQGYFSTGEFHLVDDSVRWNSGSWCARMGHSDNVITFVNNQIGRIWSNVVSERSLWISCSSRYKGLVCFRQASDSVRLKV
jgi:hypothetical protein